GQLVKLNEGTGQRARLLKAHAVRHRVDAAPVADGVFGIAAGARAHDAVARLVAAHLGAGFDHLARPFEADRRADPAVAAVGATARGGKIGARSEERRVGKEWRSRGAAAR